MQNFFLFKQKKQIRIYSLHYLLVSTTKHISNSYICNAGMDVVFVVSLQYNFPYVSCMLHVQNNNIPFQDPEVSTRIC